MSHANVSTDQGLIIVWLMYIFSYIFSLYCSAVLKILMVFSYLYNTVHACNCFTFNYILFSNNIFFVNILKAFGILFIIFKKNHVVAFDAFLTII